MAPGRRALSARAVRDGGDGHTPPCDVFDRPDRRDLRLAEEAGVCVVKPLAAGRHARVFGATSGDATVVLKVATPATMADPIGRRRFEREGQVGLLLHHPHLVRTLRHGDDWILLDDVGAPGSPACSLSARVRDASPDDGALDADAIEESIEAVAGALAHMHAKGFVHRDVKPGNILVGADGRAVLIDLGAVGLVSDDALNGREMIGSPAWMAPEQIAGEPARPSADVWSLAMVAAFALAGASVYEGSATQVLRRRREETVVPGAFVERAVSVASPRLRALILSGLSIEPRARPPARAFARDRSTR